MKRTVLFLACAALLSGGALPAQEPAYVAELRFVRRLRELHYNDLALEYILRLQKGNPSPELARALPLELARTRRDAAAEEPDTAKRLDIYTKSRADFEDFLKNNAGSPQSAEARLDIAEVAVLQGRTQLNRAWLQDTLEARVAEGLKARTTLVEAGDLIRKAAAEMDAQLAKLPEPKTPAEKAEKKRLEGERLKAELGKGLNLIDQAQTYLDEGKDAVLRERGEKVLAAAKVLEQVAGKDATNPLCWQAQAWLGRCYNETGEPKKARQKFTEILEAATPAADEGKRLARYFRLLVLKAAPEPNEKAADIIVESGERWLRDYPSYLKTPEGFGVRYLLATVNVEQAEQPKLPALKKAAFLTRARELLKGLEDTENEFTDRSRRLKVEIFTKEGGPTKKVADLKTFDECFIRAQYEMMRLTKEETLRDEKKHKEASEAVIASLQKGLALPETKGKSNPDVNNARTTLAYFCLNDGKYKEAIAAGEAFARADARSPQADMAAVYALQAYAQQLAARERNMATPEELKDDRERMLSLARFMEEHWPKGLAADVARHQIGLMHVRENKYAEAVQVLSTLPPTYASYTFSQYQLAEAALKAEEEKLPPLPGDPPGGYRARALAALQSIKDDLGANPDPGLAQVFLLSRIRLGQVLFKAKEYRQIEQTVLPVLAKLPALRLDADKGRSDQVREQMQNSLTEIHLFAIYGLADAEFAKANYTKTAEMLDRDVVEAFNAGKLPLLKNNPQLGRALLSMDLRANVQLGKLDRAPAVFQALQNLAGDTAGEKGSALVLQQMAGLIREQVEELRKKNDKESLQKAVAGFTAVLEELTKKQTLTPELTLLLARNFDSLEQYDKAAALLAKVDDPRSADPKVEGLYRGIRLMFVRELRQTRDEARLKEARKTLGEILGTRANPGWGHTNIEALKEDVALLKEEKQYSLAARKANELVRKLLPKVNTDNAMKEQYLELYYHIVDCFLKHGQEQTDQARHEKEIKNAAQMLADLEKRHNGFGSDASAKRFTDLLSREPELKAQYEVLKGK